ncbi:hypothetical protein AB0F43_29850 [Kribbella sp. NPDC023972]|uniref:effector-associated constant component EACC1 n=1 Tax=Kribbella sp. NPDC023972 TaxID=3154795 RepID=UPI0033F59B11
MGAALDEEGVEKAVRQLRKELAEQEFMTQAVVEEAPGGAKGDGLAVALVGAGGRVPALIAVLKDWICRRHSPGTIKLTLGDRSIEVDKPTFKEREQLLEAFLGKQEP